MQKQNKAWKKIGDGMYSKWRKTKTEEEYIFFSSKEARKKEKRWLYSLRWPIRTYRNESANLFPHMFPLFRFSLLGCGSTVCASVLPDFVQSANLRRVKRMAARGAATAADPPRALPPAAAVSPATPRPSLSPSAANLDPAVAAAAYAGHFSITR